MRVYSLWLCLMLAGCALDRSYPDFGACVVEGDVELAEVLMAEAAGLPGQPQREAAFAGFLAARAPCEVDLVCGWYVANCRSPASCLGDGRGTRVAGFFDADLRLRGWAHQQFQGSQDCTLPRSIEIVGELPPCWDEIPHCEDDWPECAGW